MTALPHSTSRFSTNWFFFEDFLQFFSFSRTFALSSRRRQGRWTQRHTSRYFPFNFYTHLPFIFQYKTKTLKMNVEMNGLVGHIPGVQQGRRRMYSSRWDEVCAQTFARKGDRLLMQILFVGLGGPCLVVDNIQVSCSQFSNENTTATDR